MDLGPAPPPPIELNDPLDALSALGGPGPAPAPVDPFGPELSLDSLGPAPGLPSMPAGTTGELELDFGSSASGPGDPFDSALDEPLAAPLPATLDDPFGSALEPSSPFDEPAASSPAPAPDSPFDSIGELGSPGGASTYSADPVSAEAIVEIPAGSLKADVVDISVPVEINLAGRGREILIPIRLQLKIRIR